MKKIIQNIPVKLLVSGIFSVICLFFIGILFIFEHQIQNKLYDQQMAKRWSKAGDAAQISAFFTEDAVEDEFYFRQVEENVKNALKEASIMSENENARLWIDAVSRSGKIVVSSERATMELTALGVEGEFFQFHPQRIVNGALFREDSMMNDGIVIDEETAWQLFGSSDVAGMQVMIGQVPHFITGVIERTSGRMSKAAGLDKSVCYLSLESLENYGSVAGGFTYEIVMPNPIKNFAFSTMQKILGTENEEVVVLENSSRYEILSIMKVIQKFGTRSMSIQGIVFPYWENIARGWEDILSVFLMGKILLLLYPCIFAVGILIYLWKRKKWTLKQGITWVQDKIYEAESRRVKRKQEEKNEEGSC